MCCLIIESYEKQKEIRTIKRDRCKLIFIPIPTIVFFLYTQTKRVTCSKKIYTYNIGIPLYLYLFIIVIIK